MGMLLLLVFKQWLLEAAQRFRVSKPCQQRCINGQTASGCSQRFTGNLIYSRSSAIHHVAITIMYV